MDSNPIPVLHIDSVKYDGIPAGHFDTAVVPGKMAGCDYMGEEFFEWESSPVGVHQDPGTAGGRKVKSRVTQPLHR